MLKKLPTLHLKLSLALKLESALLGLGLGLVVFGTLLTTIFFFSYRNKFYPGVTIEGVPVGGQTREDAYTILQSHQPLNSYTVTLAVEDIQLASNSAQLNLKKDYGAVIHEAFYVPCEALFQRLWARPAHRL